MGLEDEAPAVEVAPKVNVLLLARLVRSWTERIGQFGFKRYTGVQGSGSKLRSGKERTLTWVPTILPTADVSSAPFFISVWRRAGVGAQTRCGVCGTETEVICHERKTKNDV